MSLCFVYSLLPSFREHNGLCVRIDPWTKETRSKQRIFIPLLFSSSKLYFIEYSNSTTRTA